MTVTFNLLGRVEAHLDNHVIDIGHPRQRCVLVALLVELNRPVPIDVLIDRTWGESPPVSARSTLYGYLSRLRQALPPTTGVRITHSADGYSLAAEKLAIDIYRFDQMVGEALATPDGAQSLVLLDRALALWTGEALSGLDTPWIDSVRQNLEKQRVAVELDQADLALRLGQHNRMLGVLAERAAARPLDERLAGQLMLSLYRGGRQAEALQHYQATRLRLADEFGIDPSPSLQDLYRQILTNDPNMAPTLFTPAAPPLVPRQLPAPPGLFAGRSSELALLGAALGDSEAKSRVVVVAGPAGMGKTALVLRWAHQVSSEFLDGQLFIDLRGYAADPPVRPIEALSHLLNGLGMANEQIPTTTSAASALYRSLLANRRVLVVLDNAIDADQVRPLLPGSAAAATVITSRGRLAGLTAREGAEAISLQPLSEDEALSLVGTLLGDARATNERSAIIELVRICAYTPLALRIAATNLVNDSYQSVHRYVEELKYGNRLASLEVAGDPQTAISATFDLSYIRLNPAERRLFRILGVAPMADFTTAAAAAISMTSAEETRKLLNQLAHAHLLVRCGPDRFDLHDLLRLHARMKAEQEESDEERANVVRRLLDWYLLRVDQATSSAYPHLLRIPIDRSPGTFEEAGLPDHVAALQWCAAEQRNVLIAIQHAAQYGPREMSWLLADAFRGYLYLNWHPLDLLTVGESALVAAETADNAHAITAMHFCIASARYCSSQYDLAIRHFSRGVEVASAFGWEEAVASGLGNLGVITAETGQMRTAIKYYTEAVESKTKLKDLASLAVTLGNLGDAWGNLGDIHQAAHHLEAAVKVSRAAGARATEGANLANLGGAYRLLARYEQATECLLVAITVAREFHDRHVEVMAQLELAAIYRDLGQYDTALECAQAGLALSTEIAHLPGEAEARNIIGSLRLRSGPHDQAVEQQENAVRLMAEANDQVGEITIQIDLSETYSRIGDPGRARDIATKMRAMASAREFRLLEGRAITSLAAAELAAGRAASAAALARDALDIHSSTGYRLGAAGTLTILGDAHRLAGDMANARGAWLEAHVMYSEIGVAELEELESRLAATAENRTAS